MSKTRDTGFLGNVVKYDANGNVNIVSGSTTLLSVSSSGQLTVPGNEVITGSLTVLGGITGAITGSATSASYAANTSLLNGSGSGEFVPTGSFNAFSSSVLTYTGSVNSQLSALQTTSGSNITRISALESASGSAITRLSALEVTSGSNITRLSSLEARTGSYATTGSNTFIGNQTITGSVLQSGSLSVNGCIVSTGAIVAQTINVQQVTSSVVYSCGSNIFGTAIGNTQTFTGSMFVTGSLTVTTTAPELQVGATGVTLGNTITDTHNVTGSLRVSGSGTFTGNISAPNIAVVGSNTFNSTQNISLTNVGQTTALKLTNLNGSSGDTIDIDYSVSGGGTVMGRISSQRGTVGGTLDIGLMFSTYSGSLSEKMRIQGNGNIGIGTTSPQARLDVLSTLNVQATGNSDVPHINFSNNGRSFDWGRVGGLLQGDGDGALYFSTKLGGGVTEKLRITSAGVACFSSNVCVGNSLVVGSTSVFGSDMFTYQNGGIFFSGGGSYAVGVFGRNNGCDLILQSGGVQRVNITTGVACFASRLCSPALTTQNIRLSDETTFGATWCKGAGGYPFMFADGGQSLGFGNSEAASPTSERFRIFQTGIACFSCQICAPTLDLNSSGTGTLTLGFTGGSSRIAGRITATESPSYNATGKLGFSVTTWGANTDYGLTEVMAIDMRNADNKNPVIWMNPFGGKVGIGNSNPNNIVDIYDQTYNSNTVGVLAARTRGGGTFITGRVVTAETSNQTLTIATFSAAGTNERIFVKVQVVNVSAVNNYGNVHVGYALWSGSGGSSVTTMTLDTGNSNIGNSNVGSLSWSGNNLQYTTNRGGNYELNSITIWASARDTGVVS